tara:strand:+ start:4699 stop:7506 length:2808 start_codon:yes stop_codon:yes gene_type:complete
MALSNAPKRSNVSENWLFDFTADNNNCIDFDGSDDNIIFGDILGSEVNFTIEFWCKADSKNSGVIIQLSSGSGESEAENVSFNVNLQSGGEFRLFYEYGSGSNETNTTSSFNLSEDTWTHVAVVRDDASGNALFYKNGVLVETESASNDPTGGTSTDAKMTIGNNFNSNNGFNGELAHVRVWNVARSADEVSYYYNRLVDSTHTGLVGYWKLDEGTGVSVADSSSNNNSGTISGALWSVGGFDQFIHAFGLSFKDTTVSSNYYVGSVLNNSIAIRDSIDINSGQSSTSNITITSANFKKHGSEFYKLLFNGTNNFHNKEVRVFAQYDYEDTLSNCQQIFSGRLVDVQLDGNANITMQINSHRPWDGIEFPQTKHEVKNVYEPVVYGQYNPSDLSASPKLASYGGLFPVPVIDVSSYTEDGATRGHINTIMPKAYSAGDNNHLHIHMDDYFFGIRLSVSESTIDHATVLEHGVNILKTSTHYFAMGHFVPSVGVNEFGVTMMSNMENAFIRSSDGSIDTSTFASQTMSSDDQKAYIQHQSYRKEFSKSTLIGARITVEADRNDGNTSDTNQYDITARKNGSTLNSNNISVNSNTQISQAVGGGIKTISFSTEPEAPTQITYEFSADEATTYPHTLKIYGITTNVKIDLHDKDDGDDDAERLANKKFYSGGAGLTASWDSDAIVHGHDAHRDLLQRFAGISSADPENWSSLVTDRTRNTADNADIDTWKIRYWQLEPTSLKSILDKMAYEFCFNYKISASGNLKYIHVKRSSELAATVTLSKADIKDLQLKTTGLSEVVTKMEIANNLHPAVNNKYYNYTTNTNTTSRAKYNLGDKEGFQQINLDMNVGEIPSTADADLNADWYSYRNHLIGDMKIIVECQIINLAKGYQLETGDIISFTDMPIEMFGTDFSASKFFIITEYNRSIGNVRIVAREVS